MFFVLSKTLFFLLTPINWIVGLLLYAFFGKHERRTRRAFKWGLVLLVVLSNPFLSNTAFKWWEQEAVPISQLDGVYDIAIVLGGFSDIQEYPRDRLHLSEAADRLTNALELYKTGKVRKILVTSGSAMVVGEKISEGKIAGEFLARIGIPESDVIIEPNSRNTHENALFTAQILKEKHPNARCLLITSAFHFPRARRTFKKAGVEFTDFPTDILSDPMKWTPQKLILPSVRSLSAWQILIKEWVGLAAYKILGYA